MEGKLMTYFLLTLQYVSMFIRPRRRVFVVILPEDIGNFLGEYGVYLRDLGDESRLRSGYCEMSRLYSLDNLSMN